MGSPGTPLGSKTDGHALFQERQVSSFSGTSFSRAVSSGTSRQDSETHGHALFQESQMFERTADFGRHVSTVSGPRLTPVLSPGPDIQCREFTPVFTTHDQEQPSSMFERSADFGNQFSKFSGPRIPPALPPAQSVVQLA